ncbi:MAG: hypothetical protein HY858_06060 [Candidatus Solibacter usitatus]|nr:hypothetical protein [Candidatus Solibacter usitatus]
MKTLSSIVALLALTLPAFAGGVAGKWKMSANAPDGNTYKFDLVVKDDAGKLSASLNSERGSMPLKDVALNGDDFTFKLSLDMGDLPFKLKLDGDALKGSVTTPDGATGAVSATRDDAAAAAQAAPVSATGKWKIVARIGEDREMRYTLDLKQDGAKLTGEIGNDEGLLPISEGKIDGAQISFKVASEDGVYTVTGTVSVNEVKGTYKAPNGSGGAFTAAKAI